MKKFALRMTSVLCLLLVLFVLAPEVDAAGQTIEEVIIQAFEDEVERVEVKEYGMNLEQIREELVPLYRELNQEDPFAAGRAWCMEEEVFDYVRSAAEAMGGVTAEAFRLLEQAELYDIRSNTKKSGMSFEVYLSKYYEPYIFLSGSLTQYDCLTFAHEFGHFATDYAAAGSTAGIDVLEVYPFA